MQQGIGGPFHDRRGMNTSTMTVKAASAAVGVYMIRVRATGDDPSSMVQYKVTVLKSSYGY